MSDIFRLENKTTVSEVMEFVRAKIDKIEVRASVCDVYKRINILRRALDQFSQHMYNDDMLVSRTGLEFTHQN